MKNNKGFTLIELLVVIAIIAILSSIALVALTSSKEKASTASAKKIESAIISSLTFCASETNPVGGVSQPGSSTTGTGDICTVGTNRGIWPSLVKSGYNYVTPVDTDITDGNYTFTLTKAGQPTITCSLTTSNCTTASVITPPVVVATCADGIDNDDGGSGPFDNADPDCHRGHLMSGTYNAYRIESPSVTECSDGINNGDGDSYIDEYDSQCGAGDQGFDGYNPTDDDELHFDDGTL